MNKLCQFLAAFARSAFLASLAVGSAPSFAGFTGGMNVIEINGYQVVGAEYWPFEGDEPFRYPGDVLWGFYPESASPEAVACAEKSYRVLTQFLEDNWAQLRKAVHLGATRRFYLWTDDYTNASRQRALRVARMWHWNSGTPDYRTGYWKWEAVLTQDGNCLIPNDDQIRDALADAIRALSR